MNVLIIGPTSRLVQILQAIPGIGSTFYALEPGEKNAEVVLLDDIDFPQFELTLATFPDTKLIYVFNARTGLDDERYKRIREKCAMHNMPLVTDLSDGQVSEEIERSLFPDRIAEKVQPSIALVSCHRRAGRLTFARAIAKAVSSQVEGSVGLVDLNPYAYMEKRTGIFHLYREYEAGMLNPSRVKSLAASNGNLYEIGGNSRLDVARDFEPEPLKHVLGMIEEAFDFTVYAVSPYWDNTLTLIPLKSVKRKYLLATSKAKEMDEFYAAMQQVYYLTRQTLRGHPFFFNLDGIGGESKAVVSGKLGSGAVVSAPLLPRLKAGDDVEILGLVERFAQTLVADLKLKGKDSSAVTAKPFWRRLLRSAT